MKLDPTKLKDWQVAEAAEEHMKPVGRLAEELGLQGDELIPMGHKLAKVDYLKALDRLKDAPEANYIDVTAITPTPLGEGKTTTAVGLIQGLGKINKEVVGAIRQPSGAVHPADALLNPPDRRYRQHYKRTQPRYGRSDLADAAREEL